MNAFRDLMNQGGTAPLGTWLMSGSPIVAEAMGRAGFAWGVVDMEHAPLDLGHVVAILQALAGTPMVPVTRVPWNDTVTIKRVLDAGAQTLLVPFVQDAAEAARAVAATRYPPEGVRGMAGMSRASAFGTAVDHYTNANRNVAVIVQLESRDAVRNLEVIAAVPGVEGLFLGPADLSGSLGVTGRMDHPDVLAAMADAARRARAAGRWIGTVGGNAQTVRQYRDMGYDFVAVASDLGLAMRGATSLVQELGGSARSVDRQGY
jgi:2-keto-3-deoxy-L-rhamnonate aldolase RhmA